MTTTYAWADHRIFPGPEGALLFGVDQASLFDLDEEARETLGRWRAREPLLLDDAPAGDRQVLEDLRDARILIPAEHRRPGPEVGPDPASVPLGTLVLEVAQACNLRCAYCYAGGGSYGGEERLLSPERARRAVRHLVAASGDREELTLVLFGGEPLLNVPAVRAAVEEATTRAREAGKRVRISLTTNGTLVTEEVARFLRDHRVGVAVSLDGPADLHDANRRDARGAGSYDRVVAALGPLLRDAAAPVAARVTLVPSQWGRVPEVFDHLLGLGFHEVGIAPASPVTPDLLPTPEEEDALFAGFTTLAGRLEAAARAGQFLPFGNLLDLLARIHAGQAKSVSCGAGLGYLALDADGRFFLCHRLAGEEDFRVGDLDAGPDPEGIRRCLERLAAPRRGSCAACWARTLCAGGCHYENHLRETLLGEAPGGNCAFIRRWLELGLAVYARLRRGGGDVLLDRLGRRAP